MKYITSNKNLYKVLLENKNCQNLNSIIEGFLYMIIFFGIIILSSWQW